MLFPLTIKKKKQEYEFWCNDEVSFSIFIIALLIHNALTIQFIHLKCKFNNL